MASRTEFEVDRVEAETVSLGLRAQGFAAGDLTARLASTTRRIVVHDVDPDDADTVRAAMAVLASNYVEH